jgi:uncharacterized protein (TIRG00374 family)
MSPRKERLILLSKLLVTVIAVWYLVSAFNFSQAIKLVVDIDVVYFGLAILVGFLGIIISTVKWKVLLGAKGEDLSLWVLLRTYCAGVFYNAILPSTIGGDAVRATRLSSTVEEDIEAYSSVYMERFTGVVALSGIALIGVLVGGVNNYPKASILVVSISVSVGLLALIFASASGQGLVDRLLPILPGLIQDRIGDFYYSVRGYRSYRQSLVWALIISIIFQLLTIVFHLILAQGLEISISFAALLVVVPISQVILFAPISVQGYGVREVVYVVLFGGVGVGSEQAIALSLSVQLIGLAQSAIAGLISMVD